MIDNTNFVRPTRERLIRGISQRKIKEKGGERG